MPGDQLVLSQDAAQEGDEALLLLAGRQRLRRRPAASGEDSVAGLVLLDAVAEVLHIVNQVNSC